MSNITTLRGELYKVFQDLRSGEVDVKVAAEMNNTAGKIINTLRTELQYAELRGDPPNISFLNEGGATQSLAPTSTPQ